MDDLEDLQPGKTYNLSSIQRQDSRGTDLHEACRAQDPTRAPKARLAVAKQDEVLNADLRQQLEISEDLMRRAALSPQVRTGHG